MSSSDGVVGFPGVLDAALINEGARSDDWNTIVQRSRERAAEMYHALALCQRAPVVDDNPWVSALCPRRSGKSFMASSAALITGEANPGSIVLVISQTLKALKRNYWFGSRSGMPFLSKKHGLNLVLNSSELRWEHENGSIGYLLGAEDRNQMEYLRGIEADLYIVDECKSFSPAILEELVTDILSPQRISRLGRIMMIGTPGSIFSGPFYQATCPDARHEDETSPEFKRTYLVPWGQEDPWGRPRRHLWSFHHWGLEDNEQMAHQWAEALDLKAQKGWSDDHPTWQREYKGMWITTAEGLVYNYGSHKEPRVLSAGEVSKVNWKPDPSEGNPTGLPPELGPWHIVMGLDLGFNDPTAIVVAGWSETVPELRIIHTEKHAHLNTDEVALLVNRVVAQFGRPETVAVDTGGSMAKSFAETLIARYGLPVIPAAKQDKNGFIELVNTDFAAGRIKVVSGSDLEEQLLSVQWDLTKGGLKELAHSGKLQEDKGCPNDVTDAFLYMWRDCHHHFAKAKEAGPVAGTLEWWEAREKRALERARSEVSADIRAKEAGRSSILTRENVPFGQSGVREGVPWRLRAI